MKEVKIKIASIKRLILIYLLYLFSVVILCYGLFVSLGSYAINNIFVIIIISVISLSLFYFTKKMCSKTAILFIDDEKLIVVKNTFFYKENKYEIRFTEIKNYLFQKDQYFNVFRVYQKKGKLVKLFMFNDDLENEMRFLKFYSNFEKRILKENLNRLDNQKIEKKATIYESKFGLFVAIFLLAILVVLPIIYAFSDRTINLGSLLVLCSSGAFFLYKVYIARKK